MGGEFREYGGGGYNVLRAASKSSRQDEDVYGTSSPDQITLAHLHRFSEKGAQNGQERLRSMTICLFFIVHKHVEGPSMHCVSV